MAFLDKVLGKDERERQLEKEIRSLELRKESILSTINGEISRLRGERNNVLLAVGTAVYEAHKKESGQPELQEYWSKIEDLEGQITEQESKKEEMTVKYDEEIRLINANLAAYTASMAAPAGNGYGTPVNNGYAAAAPTGKTCPECGAPVAEGNVFCRSCGTKLQ